MISKVFKAIINDASAFGGLFFYSSLVIFLFLNNMINFSIYLFISLVLIIMLIIPARLLFFRERPKKQRFNSLLGKVDASSFPSLHTSRVMVILIGFFKFYQFNIFLNTFILLTGLLVMYSRIKLKKHYLTDIIGGIFFGGIIGYLVSLFF